MKPREKLIKMGVDNLSMVELASLMVGSGVGNRDYKVISKDLALLLEDKTEKADSVGLEDIREIEGMGIAKGSSIIAGIEIGRRLYDRGYKNRVKLTTTKDAVKLFHEISDKSQEHLKAAFINARYEVIAKETLGIGTLDQVGLHPRDIISKALAHNCYGVIIAHNHPSGDPTPSSSDKQATERLNDACKLMGIKLLDHIILSEEEWCRVKF